MGCTAHAINVVFPIISLSSVQGQFEVEEDAEFGEQAKAIHLFVNQVNDEGGINGRKINPMIVPFDPADDASIRALCKQWTEGNPPVFAVLDGVGTTGRGQRAVHHPGRAHADVGPMDHHHRLDGTWSALPVVDRPRRRARPQATVNWGLSSGRLGPWQEGGRGGLGPGQ